MAQLRLASNGRGKRNSKDGNGAHRPRRPSSKTRELLGKLAATLEPRLEPHIKRHIDSVLSAWLRQDQAEAQRNIRIHAVVLGVHDADVALRATARFRAIRGGNGAKERAALYANALRAESMNAAIAWMAELEIAAKAASAGAAPGQWFHKGDMLPAYSDAQRKRFEKAFEGRFVTAESLRLALRALQTDLPSAKLRLPTPALRLLDLRGVKLTRVAA